MELTKLGHRVTMWHDINSVAVTMLAWSEVCPTSRHVSVISSHLWTNSTSLGRAETPEVDAGCTRPEMNRPSARHVERNMAGVWSVFSPAIFAWSTWLIYSKPRIGVHSFQGTQTYQMPLRNQNELTINQSLAELEYKSVIVLRAPQKLDNG